MLSKMRGMEDLGSNPFHRLVLINPDSTCAETRLQQASDSNYLCDIRLGPVGQGRQSVPPVQPGNCRKHHHNAVPGQIPTSPATFFRRPTPGGAELRRRQPERRRRERSFRPPRKLAGSPAARTPPGRSRPAGSPPPGSRRGRGYPLRPVDGEPATGRTLPSETLIS